MKKIIFITFTLLFLISCKNEEAKLTAFNEKTEKEPYKFLYGNWVGDFTVSEHRDNAEYDDYVYSNKINIVIKRIQDAKVTGLNIVAGNARPVSGNMTIDTYGDRHFVLKEPGNHKGDGVFTFNIKNDTLSGEWIANNKNAIVTKRTFKLVKQKFEYKPEVMLPDDNLYFDIYSMKVDSTVVDTLEVDGEEIMEYSEMYRAASDVIYTINSSTKLLTEEDVKNLKKLELEILRNTIFARHGYTFKKKSYRQFFDPVDWYIPVSEDVSDKLTTIEKKNITLLERFEKYAEDNYDSFGR